MAFQPKHKLSLSYFEKRSLQSSFRTKTQCFDKVQFHLSNWLLFQQKVIQTINKSPNGNQEQIHTLNFCHKTLLYLKHFNKDFLLQHPYKIDQCHTLWNHHIFKFHSSQYRYDPYIPNSCTNCPYSNNLLVVILSSMVYFQWMYIQFLQACFIN
jgi:hypothetical protein